jgi:hypothetical protein
MALASTSQTTILLLMGAWRVWFMKRAFPGQVSRAGVKAAFRGPPTGGYGLSLTGSAIISQHVRDDA